MWEQVRYVLFSFCCSSKYIHHTHVRAWCRAIRTMWKKSISRINRKRVWQNARTIPIRKEKHICDSLFVFSSVARLTSLSFLCSCVVLFFFPLLFIIILDVSMCMHMLGSAYVCFFVWCFIFILVRIFSVHSFILIRIYELDYSMENKKRRIRRGSGKKQRWKQQSWRWKRRKKKRNSY